MIMNSAGNETLDRIQQEIQETLEREEELRKKYSSNNNNNGPEEHTNGYSDSNSQSPEPPLTPTPPPTTNGKSARAPQGRMFAPNPSSKGVMQKFLKMRGKMNVVAMKPQAQPQTIWIPPDTLEPAKVTIEAGKPIRNGFVPAEVKMRRELQEFQQREEELRNERRKSQPDLMAALGKETDFESNLKSARSTALLYSTEDLTDENYSSPSLKPARSLAELCDASDEELETRGTHQLIRQFENLRSQS